MGACKHACTLFIMPTFNPSPNAHVMTGDDAFYGDGQDDNWSPLAAFFNFMSGSTQQQQLQSNQQEFQEYMYNQYNSPEALVRQFKDAGLNVNMLGSTSFGTANGAAAAPSAAPAHGALEGLAKVAETGASAANLIADTGLKVAQKATEMTLPDLNRALTGKYGVESQLTDIQYNTAKQTLDWMRDDRECTAMTMRVAYFQACQMYKNSVQEFQNMVKEGQLLDESIDREHWEASIKKQISEFFVDHHYFPDQNYLDYIYNEYVINGNADGFNKWMNGQNMLFEHQNRQAARFGAYGNTIKIGGVEVPLEYLLQSGKDLLDLVKEYNSTDDKPSWFKRTFGGIFNSDNSSNSNSSSQSDSESQYSDSDLKKLHRMDDVIRAYSAGNPDVPMDSEHVTNILRDEGYSWWQIGRYLEYRHY